MWYLEGQTGGETDRMRDRQDESQTDGSRDLISTLDLRVNILPLRTHSQQLYQGDVVSGETDRYGDRQAGGERDRMNHKQSERQVERETPERCSG